MRKITIPIEVHILEEDDVVDVTDEARISGQLREIEAEIASNLPGRPTVNVSRKTHPRRGSVPNVRIDGYGVEVGAGIAFHATFPGGSIPVGAEIIAAAGEKDVAKASVAKKVTKKAVKKAASGG